MENEKWFVDGCKKLPQKSPVEILNWYRNLYYQEPPTTEHGIMARAINDCSMLLSGNAQPVVHEIRWERMELWEAVDRVFGHNEYVKLWHMDKEVNEHFVLWSGMAHNIPEQYLHMPFVKIFGTIPRGLFEADTINIEIDLPHFVARKVGGDHHD